MAAVGGSIENISIKGRLFPVAADAGATRKLGGFENAVESNGDGSARLIKTRVPWMLGGLTVEVDDTRGDQQFLHGIADRKDFVPVDITFASGFTWQGKGQITEAVEYDSQKATAQISLAGPSNFTQQ